jgi:tryptophan 2,3-dioxygenase
MSEEKSKYTTIHYRDYLQIDKLLSAQQMRSEAVNGKVAHDEMLFIVTHQVYELWFKQCLHELTAIHQVFSKEEVLEQEVGTAVARINRVVTILKLMIDQIHIMETMTPLDFLEFRDLLFPASGFQSFQFRHLEVLLGLKNQTRITYNNKHFASVFSEQQQQQLAAIETNGSMVKLIEKWLERTPFLDFKGFNFLKYYEQAVNEMLVKEQMSIKESPYLSEEEKAMRLQMLGTTNTYFNSILNKEAHENLRATGAVNFSYDATIAALLINLYRDEPILRMPFNLLSGLMDIDEALTAWRSRHAQMVLRMLGKKIGTGGSSGHEYLAKTAADYHIFSDLYNVSTLLIPRSELPELTEEVKKHLGFYFYN